MWAPTPSFLVLLLPAELRQLLLPTPPPGSGCWALPGSSESGRSTGRVLVQKAAPPAPSAQPASRGWQLGGDWPCPEGPEACRGSPKRPGSRGMPRGGAVRHVPCTRRRSACPIPCVSTRYLADSEVHSKAYFFIGADSRGLLGGRCGLSSCTSVGTSGRYETARQGVGSRWAWPVTLGLRLIGDTCPSSAPTHAHLFRSMAGC